MFLGISVAELALLALAMLAAGAVTGLLAGLFGVGGGAVIVPVLYEVFRVIGVPEEVRMALSVGTSLAIIIPTSLSSFLTHRSKGAVDMSVLKAWAVPVVVGVAFGSFVASYAPAVVFKVVFVVVALASATKLLFGKQSWRISSELPGAWPMRAYGGLIGILSTLMGIGGGQLANLFLTFFGKPIHQSIATSSGLGILISIPGTIGYVLAGWSKASAFPTVAALQVPLAFGYVSILGALLIIPTSMALAPYGARLAHSMPKRKLEIAFGIFLVVVSSRFVWLILAS